MDKTVADMQHDFPEFLDFIQEGVDLGRRLDEQLQKLEDELPDEGAMSLVLLGKGIMKLGREIAAMGAVLNPMAAIMNALDEDALEEVL